MVAGPPEKDRGEGAGVLVVTKVEEVGAGDDFWDDLLLLLLLDGRADRDGNASSSSMDGEDGADTVAPPGEFG